MRGNCGLNSRKKALKARGFFLGKTTQFPYQNDQRATKSAHD